MENLRQLRLGGQEVVGVDKIGYRFQDGTEVKGDRPVMSEEHLFKSALARRERELRPHRGLRCRGHRPLLDD
jgi:hypothetical protein